MFHASTRLRSLRSGAPVLTLGVLFAAATSVVRTPTSAAATRSDVDRSTDVRSWTGVRPLEIELPRGADRAPRRAVLRLREVWEPCPDVRTVWGTWRWETESSPRRPHDVAADSADGELLMVRDGVRLTGCLTGLGSHDLIVHASDDGGTEVVRVPASPRQDATPLAASVSIDHIRSRRPHAFSTRARPLRTREVLVLFTPRALIDAGGRREHLRHCVRAALGTASEAFGASELRTTFFPSALMPVPVDERDVSLLQLWRAAAAASAEADPLGDLVARLARRARPDIVLLVTGRRPRERVGGFGATGREGRPALAVVPVAELRSGDLTLAHELGHCLGLEHTEAGVMSLGCGEGRTPEVEIRTTEATPEDGSTR